MFGNREEYEAALRGDPVPRFRARLVETARSTPTAPIRSRRRSATRWKRRCKFALDDPFPEPEAALKHVYA